MVYVLNIHGEPLMPCKEAKARRLLKSERAEIIKRNPFTIQLTFACENYTQPITLGVDAGSRHIGLSATTEKHELYASDVVLRNDIVDLLATRSQNRRLRRNRLRYRKARFDNRVKSKHKGWLAPSVEQKIQCHLKVIENIHKILPITKIVVEVASFDIQKIKNSNIKRNEYQEGDQLGFWNVREYVLWRDGHECQYCKGKSKNNILNVHHIESRKTGGNAPNNLITLCETCHKRLHKGEIELKIRRGKSYKDSAFMGIMRWTLCDRLKALYSNVQITYGYITKNTRIKSGLPKNHHIDAKCITGNPQARDLGYCFFQKKVRCHNRRIHKSKLLKGGKKKMNQAPYLVKGFRIFDKVKYNGIECFIYGRRLRGYFDLRSIEGNVVSDYASYKKLRLLEIRKSYITTKKPLALRTEPIISA